MTRPEGAKVRLAISGFGLVGRRHAQAISQCNEAECIAVIEPNAQARQDAEAIGCSTFDDLASFFGNAANCDGVILATPNALHVEQALACVAQRYPVLIEKPIATKSTEAARLVHIADAAGVPLLVGHHRRYNPIVQAAKEVIASGQIGEVRAVHATCWLYKPEGYFETAQWRKQPGAGPVSVNLVHDVDLIRHLCGEVQTVRAAAAPSVRGYQNEDVASAILELDTGAIATVTVSDSIVAPWSWEMTSREYPVYPTTSETCYMIGGSHGSLSVPDLKLWSYGAEERDWWTPISATALKCSATDPLVNQIAHFAAVIRNEAKPLVSGYEGSRTLEVIEAIHTSAATGKAVELNPTRQQEVAEAV